MTDSTAVPEGGSTAEVLGADELDEVSGALSAEKLKELGELSDAEILRSLKQSYNRY